MIEAKSSYMLLQLVRARHLGKKDWKILIHVDEHHKVSNGVPHGIS